MRPRARSRRRLAASVGNQTILQICGRGTCRPAGSPPPASGSPVLHQPATWRSRGCRRAAASGRGQRKGELRFSRCRSRRPRGRRSGQREQSARAAGSVAWAVPTPMSSEHAVGVSHVVARRGSPPRRLLTRRSAVAAGLCNRVVGGFAQDHLSGRDPGEALACRFPAGSAPRTATGARAAHAGCSRDARQHLPQARHVDATRSPRRRARSSSRWSRLVAPQRSRRSESGGER